MIFPEKDRKVVGINRTHRKQNKKRGGGNTVKLTLLVLVIGALIAAGVCFRWDEKALTALSDLRQNLSAKTEKEPATQKPSEDSGEVEQTSDQGEEEPVAQEPEPEPEEPKVSLIFTGDVLLSDYVLRNYNNSGISGVLDDRMLRKLTSADILAVNHEFPFSTRGTKAPDKQYTFRVDPKYVSIINEMGVDVAGLANNHVLDFGKDALSDTFDTLDDAGVEYIGAGDSFERESQLCVIEKEGMKFGFLAASRVIPVVSWDVHNQTPGVFTTYDPTDLIQKIKESKEECDYLFVMVHWGQEHTTNLREYEQPMAHQFIDAGADAVIGAHPHVLQGVESYNGKMIYYSLGNFIFNETIDRTAAVKIIATQDGLKHVLLPAKARSAKTSALQGDEAEAVLSYIDGLSDTITVKKNGRVVPQ